MAKGLRDRADGRSARARRRAGAVACALGATLSAHAAPTTLNAPPSFSIDSTLAATSNGGLDAAGNERADVIASVRPEMHVQHQAPGLDYKLQAAATFLGYANGTQSDGVLPDVSGSLRSTIVDRWLYVDADAYLRYAEADPFGARADDTLGANRRIQSGYRLGPTLKRELGPRFEVLLSEEFGSTDDDAGERTRLDTRRTLLSIERKPTPLGAALSYSRLQNRTDASGSGSSKYVLESARFRVNWVPLAEIELGANIGEDRSDYLLSQTDDILYGLSAKWTPGPRTSIQGQVEHRFFGTSGVFRLEHRTPFLALALVLLREPVDATNSLGSLGQGADLKSFLDAILTTRYPDPTARAGVVDGIVASHGLDTRTAGAINVVGNYPQLQSSGQATVTWLGRVDTAALTFYAVTTRALTHDGDPLSGLAAAADNRQRGATFQLSHRLSTRLSGELAGTWSRYEGLGTHQGETTDEQNWRLSLTDQLSPRSRFSVGLQWNRFDSTAIGQHSFDATLLLVGLVHRF